ncbi:MAG: hypothetical protein F6K55_00650 [Moorea sp. SIO4A3]|nr:hypothetical protein [Moorena sp. SIO4A3]
MHPLAVERASWPFHFRAGRMPIPLLFILSCGQRYNFLFRQSPHLPISLSPYLPISPSPHLPISPSPHLPISPSPYPTNLLSLNATRYHFLIQQRHLKSDRRSRSVAKGLSRAKGDRF